MTLEICSQCKKTVELNKGFTVSFYTGRTEHDYKCCSGKCVDQLVKKQKTKVK